MYNKKEWKSKEVITKEALNNIEKGIADLDKKLQSRLDGSIPEDSVTMDKLGEDVRQVIEDVKDEIYATKEELVAKEELNNYATKEELAAKDEIYATKEELNIYATKEELNNYATKEELAAKDEIHATKEELNNYATKEELAAKDEIHATKEELNNYATKEELKNIDLSGYATKDELAAKDEIHATKEELNNYATKKELENIDLSSYVTKDELATKDEIHATKEELKEIEQDIIDLEGRVQDGLNATIPNNSITMDKLAEDLKQAIEDGKNVDLSGYATKEELKNIDLSGYATKEELAAKDEIHATKEELKNYATKEELAAKDEIHATKEELKNYATKKELENIDLSGYATKKELENIDLSGYATKEELENIDLSGYATKKELENIDLSGYVTEEELRAEKGDIEKLQTNEKTLVGAINELFQNANNGKQLIASAIGEPLDSNDTFSAMSTDINNLVSSFKNCLIDAGVDVNSNDKFKQLIDKLKDLNLSKGIEIVCTASLPETVVENQIVIITSNKPSTKEIKDYSNCTPTSNGQIIIGVSTTNDSSSMTPYSTIINNTVLTLYLDIATGKFNDKLETYDGYIGRNGEWLQFSAGRSILYSNGYDVMGFTNTNKWAYSSERIYFSNTSTSIDLKMKAYNGGWNDEYAYFRSSIDLTNVRQVRIVGSFNNNGSTNSGVGFVNSNSFTTYPTWAKEVNLTSSVKEVITDVSSLKGSYYFGTVNRCDGTARNAMKITEFELIY